MRSFSFLVGFVVIIGIAAFGPDVIMAAMERLKMSTEASVGAVGVFVLGFGAVLAAIGERRG